MYLSCCIWALTGEAQENVLLLSRSGFKHIDIRAIDFKDQSKPPDLPVSCVGLSFAIPEGYSLDDTDIDRSIETGRHLRKALEHAVWANAGCAYVVPDYDNDADAMARFAGQLVHLADQAEEYDIKVCIEHFPGRSLPTISTTLSFLKDIGHPNLYLLLDIGHAQISGENPTKAVETAGDRLGYVHFDDNDGENDLHLSLCDGILTEDVIERTIKSLEITGYSGGISIELSNTLEDPVGAITSSRDIIMRAGNNVVM